MKLLVYWQDSNNWLPTRLRWLYSVLYVQTRCRVGWSPSHRWPWLFLVRELCGSILSLSGVVWLLPHKMEDLLQRSQGRKCRKHAWLWTLPLIWITGEANIIVFGLWRCRCLCIDWRVSFGHLYSWFTRKAYPVLEHVFWLLSFFIWRRHMIWAVPFPFSFSKVWCPFWMPSDWENILKEKLRLERLEEWRFLFFR